MIAQSLQAYYDELRKFDWSYEYTDDFSVWRRCDDKRRQLKQMACLSPDHATLWAAFNRHGGEWQRREQYRAPETPEMPGRPA
jgi:hypothetical protein